MPNYNQAMTAINGSGKRPCFSRHSIPERCQNSFAVYENVINTYSTKMSSENSQIYAVFDHRTRDLKCPSRFIVYASGSLYCKS